MGLMPGDDVPDSVAAFVNEHGPAGLTAALTDFAVLLSETHHARPDDACPSCGETAPCEEAAWAWAWLMDNQACAR